jgi:PEP-CTERM motif
VLGFRESKNQIEKSDWQMNHAVNFSWLLLVTLCPTAAYSQNSLDLGSLNSETRVRALDGTGGSQPFSVSTSVGGYVEDRSISPFLRANSAAAGGSSVPENVQSNFVVPRGRIVSPFATTYASALNLEPINPTDSNSESTSLVSYLFRIDGPYSNNIIVFGGFSMSVFTDGGSQPFRFIGPLQNAQAGYQLINGPQVLSSNTIQCQGADCNSLYSERLRFVLSTDTLYRVNLFASSTAISFYTLDQATTIVPNSISRAFSDPYFEIDRTFPNADQYELEFSQGVNNVLPFISSVPEPNTWAMMILGFSLVGWSLRRRQPIRNCLTAVDS